MSKYTQGTNPPKNRSDWKFGVNARSTTRAVERGAERRGVRWWGRRRRRVVPRRLSLVLGLGEQPHVDRRGAGVREPLPALDGVGGRGPGEIVDVLLDGPVRRPAVRRVEPL